MVVIIFDNIFQISYYQKYRRGEIHFTNRYSKMYKHEYEKWLNK